MLALKIDYVWEFPNDNLQETRYYTSSLASRKDLEAAKEAIETNNIDILLQRELWTAYNIAIGFDDYRVGGTCINIVDMYVAHPE